MIRRPACKGGDELLGFPLIGVPMVAWMERGEAPEDIMKWREAYLAALLVVRFANVAIVHSVDGWSLLPPSCCGRTFTQTHGSLCR
jgi:CO dehydrogenase/acetyl-CoA synthase gamma subunit (corrinoid Fe-S protein)